MAKRKNDRSLATQRIQGKTVLTLPKPTRGAGGAGGGAQRISTPGSTSTRRRNESLTSENENQFLLGYDRVEAVVAYVSARLRLFPEDDWEAGGALDWVADQIITGGNPVPGDPKPPRMPGPIADEIAGKLTNDPA